MADDHGHTHHPMTPAKGPRRGEGAPRRLLVLWLCCAATVLVLLFGWSVGLVAAAALALVFVVVDALSRWTR